MKEGSVRLLHVVTYNIAHQHKKGRLAWCTSYMEVSWAPGGYPSLNEEAIASHQRLYREIIQVERAALIGLRDQGQIDDEVLREMERELDLEELRLRAEE